MKKKAGRLAALLALGMLFVTGCGVSNLSGTAGSDSDGNITIRIGEMRTRYPIKAADELGFFEEAFGDDVEIELYSFGSGPELIEALAAGEIDLSGSFGSTPVIAGIANGYPITVINGCTTRVGGPINRQAVLTRVNSGIDSVEDLAGRSFGLQIGSQEYTAFSYILEKHGLNEGDYQLASLSNVDAYTALLAGSVDAAVTIEPYITKLIDTGDYQIIAWNSEYNSGDSLQIANSDFAEAHPDLVATFLKAYFETIQWAHESEENENTVLEIVSEQIGVDVSELKTQFKTDNLYFGFQNEDVQILQDNIPYLAEHGTIAKEITLSDYVDYSFLEEAGYKDYYLQFLDNAEE